MNDLNDLVEVLMITHSTYFDSLVGLVEPDDGQMRQRFEADASKLIEKYGEEAFYVAVEAYGKGPKLVSRERH